MPIFLLQNTYRLMYIFDGERKVICIGIIK
jgi:hypothetical protein